MCPPLSDCLKLVLCEKFNFSAEVELLKSGEVRINPASLEYAGRENIGIVISGCVC
jgi:hypothetical protein